MAESTQKLTFAQRVEWCFLVLMQYLPVSWVSAIGAYLGERNARKGMAAKRLWVERLHRNFARFLHETDAKKRERLIIDYMRNLGRVYAEIAVLQRMVAQGRVSIVGLQHIPDPHQQFIIAGCHVGNWELLGHLVSQLPRGSGDLFAPLVNPLHQKLVVQMRHRWKLNGKTSLVAASDNAMRQITRILNAGDNLVMMIDEEKNGYVHAPALGRNLPLTGNRWFTARLAVRHNVAILPVYVQPVGVARYQIVVGKPLHASGSNDHDKAVSYAQQLDACFDPIVQKNLMHWYWLSLFDWDARPG